MIIKCYLPIKTKVNITQGIKSDKGGSHRLFEEAKFDDTYSIDFDLPIGTPIYAALSGVVEEVVDQFKGNYSGTDWNKGYKAYLRTNYIILKHKNGTYSLYHHLKYKSSAVKVGQKIKAGQLIGYSGNTGWSMCPHLHFSLFKKVKGLVRKTVPFRFVDYDRPLKDGYYVAKRRRLSEA